MNIGIQVTLQQRDNLLLAKQLWNERVKPEQVDLDQWRCGTHACFGGHLTSWPEFQALGARAHGDPDGDHGWWKHAPVCPSSRGGTVDGLDVADELFGAAALFETNGMFPDRLDEDGVFGQDTVPDETYEVDEHAANDHDIVNRRIDWVLANSVVVK